MKAEESGSKMWYWIAGAIIVIVLSVGGYFAYQKYHDVNAQIAEKDSIIATQQTIIEGNQKMIDANLEQIKVINGRYKSLKDKLTQYIKDAEAIQKPVGEKAIGECLAKHGFEVKK